MDRKIYGKEIVLDSGERESGERIPKLCRAVPCYTSPACLLKLPIDPLTPAPRLKLIHFPKLQNWVMNGHTLGSVHGIKS